MKLKRKSKTLWFNGAIGALLGVIEIGANSYQLSVTPFFYSTLIFISTAGNYILRFYTTERVV